MSGSPPIIGWQELEQIRVSTAHVEEVTELLLRYAAREIAFVQLASSIRLLCQEPRSTSDSVPSVSTIERRLERDGLPDDRRTCRRRPRTIVRQGVEEDHLAYSIVEAATTQPNAYAPPQTRAELVQIDDLGG
jgi:hypothetical protein